MKRCEVATLTVPIGAAGKALPRIREYVGAAATDGTLLACWTSEVGPLNQILVLRGFDSEAELGAERERLLLGGNPFGVADLLAGLSLDTYAPFPFLPPIQTGERGPFYEVRVYGIRPAGLAPTIEAWRGAVAARTRLSPLVVAMYALDGAVPRFMNIWPYRSLDERNRIRGEAVSAGIWPPKGGPEHLTTLQSGFFLPADFSPLR